MHRQINASSNGFCNEDTHQSGSRTMHGPIMKEGNSHIRWILIEPAQHASRHDPRLSQVYYQIAKRATRPRMLLAKKAALVTRGTSGIGKENEIALETIPQTTPLVADDALNPHTRHHRRRGGAQVSILWVLGPRLVERKGNRRTHLRKESNETSL